MLSFKIKLIQIIILGKKSRLFFSILYFTKFKDLTIRCTQLLYLKKNTWILQAACLNCIIFFQITVEEKVLWIIYTHTHIGDYGYTSYLDEVPSLLGLYTSWNGWRFSSDQKWRGSQVFVYTKPVSSCLVALRNTW